jgi:uncharacterized membrane protein
MIHDSAPFNFKNIFLRFHPFQKLLLSFALAGIAYYFVKDTHLNRLLHVMVAWDVFAFSMLVTSWIVIFTRSPKEIRRVAEEEDGSLLYFYLIVFFATLASMITVLLLMASNDSVGVPKEVYLPVAIGGVILSWVMVHTTFTFHYARIYYGKDSKDPKKIEGGLCFPEEDCPDYLDFAYYAFVIGMTFQVSDVETRSRRFRRITLLHSLLSFSLNTFVIALTINLIASLKG